MSQRAVDEIALEHSQSPGGASASELTVVSLHAIVSSPYCVNHAS